MFQFRQARSLCTLLQWFISAIAAFCLLQSSLLFCRRLNAQCGLSMHVSIVLRTYAGLRTQLRFGVKYEEGFGLKAGVCGWSSRPKAYMHTADRHLQSRSQKCGRLLVDGPEGFVTHPNAIQGIQGPRQLECTVQGSLLKLTP